MDVYLENLDLSDECIEVNSCICNCSKFFTPQMTIYIIFYMQFQMKIYTHAANFTVSPNILIH